MVNFSIGKRSISDVPVDKFFQSFKWKRGETNWPVAASFPIFDVARFENERNSATSPLFRNIF